ncbi:MAG: hypothetical protein QOK48_653 [Blastocatellia bacterium]|jgi:hypothetical protein|nr:hypothetical protein [Blastocatellia bacterium]
MFIEKSGPRTFRSRGARYSLRGTVQFLLSEGITSTTLAINIWPLCGRDTTHPHSKILISWDRVFQQPARHRSTRGTAFSRLNNPD